MLHADAQSSPDSVQEARHAPVRSPPCIPKGAPHFLIIGACKAGTTTLYDDLALHPDSFMPSEKEPDILHRGQDPDEILAMWRRHFRSAPQGAVRGEGSTYYTMTPDRPDVSGLARRVLGPEARIIYIMRHPLRRIESHLGHDYIAGRVALEDFDRAALEETRYVAWSDYARQVAPWIEAFSHENVLPVFFERFVSDRHSTARAVASFIGLDPDRLPARNGVSNARDSMRVPKSKVLSILLNSAIYRQRLRGLVPDGLRQVLRQAVSRRDGTSVEIALQEQTLAELQRRLSHVPGALLALGITPTDW